MARKTSPLSWEDYTIWYLLAPWRRFITHKYSHWWHWRDYRQTVMGCYSFSGDKTIRPLASKLDLFWGLALGWQRVAVFSINDAGGYQIGFVSGNTTKLCTIIITGAVGVLIGPDPVKFFGVRHPSGAPVQLKHLGTVARKTVPDGILFV